MPKSKKYYAIADGRYGQAICFTWADCEKHTKNWSSTLRPPYKSFKTIAEAEDFIFKNSNSKENVAPPPPKKTKNEPRETDGFSDSDFSDDLAPLPTSRRSKVEIKIEKPSNDDPASPIHKATDLSFSHSNMKTYKSLSDEYLRNDKGDIIVYTDGACSNNGKRNQSGNRIGKSGCGVYFSGALTYSFLNPSINALPDGKGNTNNFAEAHAIEIALEHAVKNKLKSIEIRTDSEYCINSLTKWKNGWIKNKKKNNGIWKNSKGLPVIHQNVFENILLMETQLKVTYTHVKGHSGDAGNTEADKLAVAGTQK
jgi:ribonuclease HI